MARKNIANTLYRFECGLQLFMINISIAAITIMLEIAFVMAINGECNAWHTCEMT